MSNSTGNYDVAMCFSDLIVAPCVRTSILLFLFVVTFILCVLLVIRTIYITKRRVSYQLLILYLAIIECFLAIIHWIKVSTTILDFFLSYLKLLQLCVICYYFTSFAFLMFKIETWDKRVLMPGFLVLIIGLTVCVIFASVTWSWNNYQCVDVSFLVMDVSCLFLTIFFLISSSVLLRKLKTERISENIRKRKSSGLWTLMLVYIITSLFTVGWDFGMDIYLVLHKGANCNTVLSNYPGAQNAVSGGLRVIDLLIPLWAVLYVFYMELRQKRTKKKPTASQIFLLPTQLSKNSPSSKLQQ